MYLVLPEENEIPIPVLTYLRCFRKSNDKVIKNGKFYTENQRNILFPLEGVAKRGGEGWGGGGVGGGGKAGEWLERGVDSILFSEATIRYTTEPSREMVR